MNDQTLSIGIGFLRQQQYPLALEWLLKAHKTLGDDPEVLYALGLAYSGCAKPVEAMEALMRCRTLVPDNPFIVWEIGRQHYERLRPEEADAWYAKAEALVDRLQVRGEYQPHPTIYINLADKYLTRGKIAKARGIFDRLLALCPNQFMAFKEHMLFDLKYGTLDDVIAMADKALECAKDDDEKSEARTYGTVGRWMKSELHRVAQTAPLSPDPKGRPDMVIAQAMWGADYLTLFLYHLRSMLAPGNIPALAERFRPIYHVVTTEQNRDGLLAHPIMATAQDYIDFEFVILPDDLFSEAEHLAPTQYMYHLYSMTLHLGLAFARRNDAHATCLTADTIAADGTFGEVARRAATGPLAVVGNGLVCDRELVQAVIDQDCADPGLAIAIDAKAMAEIARPRLHELIRSSIISPSNPDFDNPPAVLFFDTPDGLIGHGFNLQPYFISAEVLARYDRFSYQTIDGHLLNHLLTETDFDRVDLIETCDPFSIVTLTSFYRRPVTSRKPFRIEREMTYVEDRTRVGPFNIWLFQKPILHSGISLHGRDEYDPTVVRGIVDHYTQTRESAA